ncbi:MAG: CpeR family transcriptional regulator [Prochloraceae cyanobacterium]
MSGLLSELERSKITMLPPAALKKMKCWIRSRHLICSGNFFVLETLEYSTVERFEDCVSSLGGTLISVEAIKKVWIGNHRQVVLYQAKASLHTPDRELKQYWIKYGGFHSKFDERTGRETWKRY